jgi:hypothetical protein
MVWYIESIGKRLQQAPGFPRGRRDLDKKEEAMKEKKVWQKPELVVLVRSNPEEAVLSACKVDPTPGAVAATQVACIWDNPPGCTSCDSSIGT